MRTGLTLFFIFFSIILHSQQVVDVKHYRFELELTDGSDAITGRALITVQFLLDASDIRLDLASMQEDKGMVVYRVQDEGRMQKAAHQNDKLLIFLDKPAKMNEVRTFDIQYMGTPKDGLIISKNKFGERTFFADNWPNRAHQWIPCVDVPSDKASFEFLVTAPLHYSVISNGIRKEETILPGQRKRTHWKEDIPLSTKIMVIGVARFAVKTYADSPRGIPVSAWTYPSDSTKGFYDYAIAPSILSFFTELIAPYPYKKLANVQSTTIFGGMENASAIFYDENAVTGTRKSEGTVAHEIIHQWFGDMATEKSFAHLWLSEGFANYLTDYYYEKKYGIETARERMREDRSKLIAFVKTNSRPVVDSTSDLMSLLNANSYQKGAWFLHMLRLETGDSIFRRIIREYYQAFRGRNAETRDFEAIAEKFSSMELTWFFDQWLYRPGLPLLDFTVKKDKGRQWLTIIQKQQHPYQFNLRIGQTNSSQPLNLHQLVPIRDRQTTIELPSGIKKIMIDPFVELLYEGKVEVGM